MKITRRTFVSGLATASLAATPGFLRAASPASPFQQAPSSDDLRARWQKLDDAVKSWWTTDLSSADESAVRRDPAKTLLYLPFPYSSAGGSEAAFPEMYGWDTQFMNIALLAHNRADIVSNHIRNDFFMIDRYGMVLNGNRTYYLTRSQPPLLAWSVEAYLHANDDPTLALQAYTALEREYLHYWNTGPHLTPTGLSTCHDSGQSDLSPQLAAEAESGFDFTPIFGGDISHCVPIHINACLVYCARVLSTLAERFGWKDKAAFWRTQADDRSRRINDLCWNEKLGYYFEYNFETKQQIPVYSLSPFCLLWAGVPSERQAKSVVSQLARFVQPWGLATTDKEYPSPHPSLKLNQWAYPAAWSPFQIIVAQGLVRYGYRNEAVSASSGFLKNQIVTWEQTGHLWERYNAVTGGHDCPIERDAAFPLHGWSSASVAILGRIVYT